MLPLLLFTSFVATATAPKLEFLQTPQGSRTANIFSSCSDLQGIYTLSSPIADVVGKSIVRFTQPVLSEAAVDRCSAVCAEGTRMVSMQLAQGGRGEVSTGLVCVELHPAKTR